MFAINEDMSIYITRGDSARFQITAMQNATDAYKFQVGDILQLKVFEKKAVDNVVLQKDFVIEAETEVVDIYLEEKDTKIGELINKPVDYWYEVTLNPETEPQTIVGYDDEGTKVFRLFPEGAEIEEMSEEAISPFVVTVKESVAEWMEANREAIKGEKGDKGDKGDQGDKGDRGDKGDQGDKGDKGDKGEDGYTPVKGRDYFDGAKGADGKDGYTPMKNVDYFDGKDGYTPVKGKDYFTEAEKEEFKEEIMDELPTSGGGVTSWNDLTDKPFYDVGEIIATIVENWAVRRELLVEGTIQIGKTYLVVLDGVEYICPCIDDGGVAMCVPEGTDLDGDEPPAIIITQKSAFLRIVNNFATGADVVVSVYEVATEIKKIDEKFLPDSMGVSSWNDLTDKPFGEEREYITIEKNVDFIADDYGYFSEYFGGENFYLQPNETYTVIFDDKEYSCKPVKDIHGDEGVLYLGNTSLYYDDEAYNTGEPFCVEHIVTEYEDGFVSTDFYLHSATGGNHTFKITVFKEVIHTISPKYIHFGEESTVSDTLEWDGDTTGLTCVGGMFYKVCDTTILNEELKNCILTGVTDDSETVINISDVYDECVSNGMITNDFAFLQIVMIVRKENTTFADMLFEDAGIYYSYVEDAGHVGYTKSLKCANPVFTTTTITPLPEKFLPDSVKALLEIVNGSEVAW